MWSTVWPQLFADLHWLLRGQPLQHCWGTRSGLVGGAWTGNGAYTAVSARASGDQIHLPHLLLPTWGLCIIRSSLPKHTAVPFPPIHPETMPTEKSPSAVPGRKWDGNLFYFQATPKPPGTFTVFLILRMRGRGTFLAVILLALPSILLATRNPIIFMVSKWSVQYLRFQTSFR